MGRHDHKPRIPFGPLGGFLLVYTGLSLFCDIFYTSSIKVIAITKVILVDGNACGKHGMVLEVFIIFKLIS